MAAWLKRAENLLNAVDTAVMKTVSNPADGDGDGAPELEAKTSKQDQSGFTYATTSPFGSSASGSLSSGIPHEANTQLPASTPIAVDVQPTTTTRPSSSDGAGTVATSATPATRSPASPGTSAATLTSVNGSQPATIDDTPITTIPSSTSSQPVTRTSLPASMAVSGGGKQSVASPLAAVTEAATGSSREQQLSRLVEQLKDRLKASKVEAEQLEDMLAKAEARCEREKALLGQLQIEVSSAVESKALMEAALNAQLNQQAVALQDAQQRADALSRQVLALEGKLAVATETSRNVLQNRTDLEGGIMDAIRSQLSTVEFQLENERRAHALTRQAAVARERELEASAAGTTAALAEAQHDLQVNSMRIRDLEDALALATAKQQSLEQQVAGGHSGPGANQAALLQQDIQRLEAELEIQRESWQQVNAARAHAHQEVNTLQNEVNRLRAEMDQGTWKKDTSTLEASLGQAHELLYQKQATIERLTADRAALQLRLEREVATAARNKSEQHHALSVTGGEVSHRSALGLSDGDQSLVPTTSVLGERYRRLASRGDNLGTALAAVTSTVDRTASVTAHLLRQYPVVRLVSLLYLLCIHLYVYWLTITLQHAAVVLDHEESVVTGAGAAAAAAVVGAKAQLTHNT